jgi:hypothetical protein
MDLDPHIQAFEILSDRVSNLEEGLKHLLAQAERQEMRAYGKLNHSLLGFRVPIYRRAPQDDYSMDPPRRDFIAQSEVTGLAIEFFGVDLNFVHRCDVGGWHEDVGFSADLRKMVSSRFAEEETCVLSAEAGLVSAHRLICMEEFERVLAKRISGYPFLSHCGLVRPIRSDNDNVAFLLTAEKPLPVRSLILECLSLLHDLRAPDVKSIHIHDCLPEEVRLCRQMLIAQNSCEGPKRDAARKCVEKWSKEAKSLENHAFFEGIIVF